MIESDYDNACIYLKRNGDIIKTFSFKEFVSAKSFKPVNELRQKMASVAAGKTILTEEESKSLDSTFYDLVTKTAFTNPLPFEDAMELMTTVEVGSLAEETLIFLINWSSIEAVKQYAKQLLETKKKESQP